MRPAELGSLPENQPKILSTANDLPVVPNASEDDESKIISIEKFK